jgi:hypothetical protein
MFEAFQAHYPKDSYARSDDGNVPAPSEQGLPEFLSEFGGASFRSGLYRVVLASEIAGWNARIEAAYPEFASQITCFAYDWLGRAFALNQSRLEGGRPGVTMFEPGTGEALEIPCNLQTFHTEGLLEFGEAALAISFFEDWLGAGGVAPSPDQRGWRVRRHQAEMLRPCERAPGSTRCWWPIPARARRWRVPADAGDFCPFAAMAPPPEGLHTLYVSPLKALAHDVQRNLLTPVEEMGLPIRIETRSGDTPSDRKKRQRDAPAACPADHARKPFAAAQSYPESARAVSPG